MRFFWFSSWLLLYSCSLLLTHDAVDALVALLFPRLNLFSRFEHNRPHLHSILGVRDDALDGRRVNIAKFYAAICLAYECGEALYTEKPKL